MGEAISHRIAMWHGPECILYQALACSARRTVATTAPPPAMPAAQMARISAGVASLAKDGPLNNRTPHPETEDNQSATRCATCCGVNPHCRASSDAGAEAPK